MTVGDRVVDVNEPERGEATIVGKNAAGRYCIRYERTRPSYDPLRKWGPNNPRDVRDPFWVDNLRAKDLRPA